MGHFTRYYAPFQLSFLVQFHNIFYNIFCKIPNSLLEIDHLSCSLCNRAIPLLWTWHFLDFERLSFSHETKKLDLNILYQCVLTCSWHNQKTLQLLNYSHLQNFKNVRCGRDARAVTSTTHVFELFKDENSWVAEVSSDCVNYIPGYIDTKYLDQAFWFHGWMTASQSLSQKQKLPTCGLWAGTMYSPGWVWYQMNHQKFDICNHIVM